MPLTVEPLSEQSGVTVSGIDFKQASGSSDERTLQGLWLKHGIMLVRGVNCVATPVLHQTDGALAFGTSHSISRNQS